MILVAARKVSASSWASTRRGRSSRGVWFLLLWLLKVNQKTTVELERTPITKIGLTPEKARKRTAAVVDHFRDAIVNDSEVLIPAMLGT